MKGYKVFDQNWKCRDFQYKVGEEYYHNGPIELCTKGFHFCKKLVDCFSYYDFNPMNKVAEIETDGTVFEDEVDGKCVTDRIKIVKELTWQEVLDLVNVGSYNSGHGNSGNRNIGNRNTGDGNSGDRNTGDKNSGNRNTGNGNSGNRNSGEYNFGDYNSGNINSGDGNSGNRNIGNENSGYRNIGSKNTGDGNIGNRNSGDGNFGHGNSGHWNCGNQNTGYFNNHPNLPIYVFNKLCDRKVWDNAEKPNFLCAFKIIYEEDGKIKARSYKESWKIVFDNASNEDIKKLIKLPNFDYTVFEEITGISKSMIEEKLK